MHCIFVLFSDSELQEYCTVLNNPSNAEGKDQRTVAKSKINSVSAHEFWSLEPE